MTTHIFYFKDHFSNGKCHFDRIGIDAFRYSLEERLHEPPSDVETLFCIRFPIRDLSMRIRGDGSRIRSQSDARLAFVLFQTRFEVNLSGARTQGIASHLDLWRKTDGPMKEVLLTAIG
jgi:hypothetical protein